MLGLMLLGLVILLFPKFPVFAALAFCGAAYAAKGWTPAGEELLLMVVFYGALIGCLLTWFPQISAPF